MTATDRGHKFKASSRRHARENLELKRAQADAERKAARAGSWWLGASREDFYRRARQRFGAEDEGKS